MTDFEDGGALRLREEDALALARNRAIARRQDGDFDVVVGAPTGERQTFIVGRDATGKVLCTCNTFKAARLNDPRFRCVHILAVKCFLENPPAAAPAAPDLTENERESMLPPIEQSTAGEVVEDPEPDGEGVDVEEMERHLALINLLADEAIRRLSEPLPDEGKKTRPDGQTYVPGEYAIRRLNEVCLGGWAFKINSYYRDEIGVHYCQGELTIFGVPRANIGTTEESVKKDSEGRPLDPQPLQYQKDERQKAAKGAVTDCLKRCAKDFGLGIELYLKKKGAGGGGSYQKREGGSSAPKAPYKPTAEELSKPVQPGQLKALDGLCKMKGGTPTDRAWQRYRKAPADLSFGEAAALISEINSEEVKA
jgi:hypothetical protein